VKNKINNKIIFVLLIILAIGFILRIIGINWDQNQHLHPDERFLTMVSSTISLPQNISNYFDTDKSVFNPQNNGFDFYVYGTFPLFITKVIAKTLNLSSYDQIFLVGRALSAIFDTITIFLVFLITQSLFKKSKISLLSSLLYAICIFPIQQSHFFTVDATTIFFFTLSLYLLINHKNLLSGLIFGIALSSKTSIGIVLPFFFLFIFLQNKNFIKNLIQCLIFGLLMCFAFRIFQPYAFSGFINLSSNFLSNIRQAHQMITGEYKYPPNVQWLKTLPIVHPIINLFFVGLGPITFILICLGIKKIFKDKKSLKNNQILLLLCIIFSIFTYHSILLAKYMRYFYPIYPLLIIFSGYALSKFKTKNIIYIFLINTLISFAFIHIYYFPHSRYQASEWICQNIPNNSILSSESWDDSLPLGSPSCRFKTYQHQDLALYDSESDTKWSKINQQLNSIDYLIMSSNRLWGSIPYDVIEYPKTSIFYKNIFDEQTNFKLIKKFYSYPGFSLPVIKKCILIGPSVYPYQIKKNTLITIEDCHYPGIYFRDDTFEESYTVYDHPQILIFQRQ